MTPSAVKHKPVHIYILNFIGSSLNICRHFSQNQKNWKNKCKINNKETLIKV